MDIICQVLRNLSATFLNDWKLNADLAINNIIYNPHEKVLKELAEIFQMLITGIQMVAQIYLNWQV